MMSRKTFFLIVILLLSHVQGGAQKPVSLLLGQKIERELRGAETHVYAITLKHGEFLRVMVEQRGIDVALTLRNAADSELLKVNFLPETGTESLSYEAAEAGQYRLEITPVVGTAPSGHYSVEQNISASATPRDRERLAAERLLMEVEALWQAAGIEKLREAVAKSSLAIAQWRKLDDKYWLAYAFNQSGVLHYDLEEEEKALNHYNQSLSLRRSVGDREGEAHTLSNIGYVYKALGQKTKALDYLNQSLSLRRATGNRLGEAAALLNIGHFHEEIGKHQEALEYYTKALALYRAIGYRSEEASTLLKIGIVYDALREQQKALEIYEEALLISQAIKNPVGEAGALNNIGVHYKDAGEPRKAIDYYLRALQLYAATTENNNKAHVLNNLGFSHAELGERPQALDYYRQAVEVYKTVGDRSGEARTLINIGRLYYDSSEKQRGLDNLQQALALYRAGNDQDGEANTLRIIGEVYNSLGERQKAIDFYQQASFVYKIAGHNRGAIKMLENIGRIYWDLGNKPKASESFQQTLPLWKVIGDSKGEADAIIVVGRYSSASGKKQKALSYLNRALTLYRSIGNRLGEAVALVEIGRVYEDFGENPKALKYYEQALTFSKAAGETRQVAVALTDIGNSYSRLGDRRKSIEYNEQSLSLWRTVGDKHGEANTLSNMGSDYSALNEKQKALDYHNQAALLFRQVEDRKREAQTLNDIAEINLHLNEKQKAIEAYQQSAQLQKAVGDRKAEATAVGELSDIYHELGDLQSELKYALAFLSLQKSLGDRKLEAIELNTIGDIYNDLEQYQTSLEYHQKALQLWRDLKDRWREADTLDDIGARYFALGKKEKSLEPFHQALSIYRSLRDHEREGQEVIRIGLAYYLLGEGQTAWEYFNQVLPLLKYPQVAALASESLLSGVSIFFLFEDYQRALEFYRQVISVSKKLDNRALLADSLISTSQIYSFMEDKPRALDALQEALLIQRKRGDLNREAAILIELGDAQMETPDFSRASTLKPDEKGNTEQNAEQIKGEIKRMGDYIQEVNANARRANEYYTQALLIYRNIKNRNGEARALLNMGIVQHVLDNEHGALSYYQKALFLVEETSAADIEFLVMYRLMKVWTDLSNPRLAIFYGKRVVNTLQSYYAGISKLDKGMGKTFLHLTEDPYRELASLLIEQGRIAEAEQVLAMLKEEEYFEYVRRDDKVAEGLLKRANLLPEEEAALKRYREKADELTRLGREYAALEAERLKLTANQPFPKQARLDELDRLRADASEVLRLFLEDLKAEFGKENVRVREVESSLQKDLKAWGDANTAAIFTIVGKDNLSIVVMTADMPPRPHTIDIPAAKLNELIGEFRAAVKDPALDPRPSAQQLYDVLVRPIEGDLKGIEARTLLWSLDGALRYVPVAALYDARQGYLAERYSNVIITLASRTNLGLQPSMKGGLQVLGLGVSKEYETFKALTEVREELRGIVRERAAEGAEGQAEIGVLDGHRLLDEQFTFTAFRSHLGRYPVVHIASHFSFQPGKESDSFLLLGGGDERKLTIDKIRKGNTMFNGVELLTLSACDTAIGGVKANGEEVESFGLLAQEQGARSVMATLWQVADPSTRELMVKFYQIYSTSPNTKAEALRRAQLQLLNGGQQTSDAKPPRAELVGRQQNKSSKPSYPTDPQKPYAHPYYWAPFILIGNWR